MGQRQIYTVEIDGRQYDIEGDRPPTEAEARAVIKSSLPAQTASVLEMGRRSAAGGPQSDEALSAPAGALDRLAGMLQPLAHPQSAADFIGLAALPTDATRGLTAAAFGEPGKRAATTALDMVDSVRHPLRSLDNLLQFARKKIQPGASAGNYQPPAASEITAETRPAASAGQLNAPAKPTPPVVPETAATATPAAPAGTVGAGLSPRAQIDAAIQKAGVKVNGRQMADLFEKVRDAKTPADQALREVLGTSASGGRSLTAIYKAASDQGLTLTAHELDTAQSLTAQMSPAEAVRKVAEMRGFTEKFNLPKPETVEANKYFPKMGNPGYRGKMPTKPKGWIPPEPK